ncbi:ATP-binding protein [Streptomyces sp. NPDC008150]|uniref:sensor histidine kinase n=1 Tax=Streptomyces sp. NPDC008150 TaxID=3364816 RepID=UPI0036ED20E9
MPENRPPNTVSGWTTRRWLVSGTGLALVLLAVLGVVGARTLQHGTQVSVRLVDHTSPALIAAVQLEAALVNQETGVRGYGLTGRRDFLEPYAEGKAQQRTATAKLRGLGVSRQDRDDLALVLRRAGAWQREIADPVVTAPAGSPPKVAETRADEGKRLFDSLRDATATQQTHLRQARADGRSDLLAARHARNIVFAAIAATLLILFLLVFSGLRRGVALPLTALSRDTRRVTGGDFAHRVTPTGPADLRALAADVEAMRLRLLDELRAAEQARAAVDQQSAELKRSNEELEQFAYVASHDLQEPLRKVASFCQLLQRRYSGQLDDKADQYIAFAVDGAARMQKLITDLLSFSRVGRVHQDNTRVDLEHSLAQALDNLGIAIEEAGADVTHDPLPVIAGDSTQLTLLLQNLIGNAVKFRAPDRPPRIHLSARQDGGLWHLAVTDNGIGIDPEYAGRVFLIFQRLHTRDTYAGSGIGLAMCRKVVDFHGGTIHVDTTHRDGTRVEFTLPATT